MTPHGYTPSHDPWRVPPGVRGVLRGDLRVMALVSGVRIELERDPHLRLLSAEIREVEVAQHADDRERGGAKRHRLPHHRGIAVESRLPQALAQDHDLIAAGPVFLGRKGAPQLGPRPEEPEELRRDPPRLQLLGEAAVGVVDDALVEGRDGLDHLRLLAVMLELGGRRRRAGALRRDVHEKDDAVGIGKWHGPQQHGVDHRKDRGIDGNAQGQRSHRGQREGGTLDEHPQGVLHVTKEGVEHAGLDTETSDLVGPKTRVRTVRKCEGCQTGSGGMSMGPWPGKSAR